MVFDDGITTRLGEQHFLMTTTTGNAAARARLAGGLAADRMAASCEVYCTSVTEQWATVGGRRARSARRAAGRARTDIDLDHAALPLPVAFATGKVAGIPARVFRISFSGELAYEINVPASYGAGPVAGADGGRPAASASRPTAPRRCTCCAPRRATSSSARRPTARSRPTISAWTGSSARQKPDFIGKRALQRADTARPDRKQLVGLLTDDPGEVLPEGGQIVAELGAAAADDDDRPRHLELSGAPIVGRSIAMALVKNGRNRMGETLYVPLADRTIAAKVTEPRFCDLEGKRLDG